MEVEGSTSKGTGSNFYLRSRPSDERSLRRLPTLIAGAVRLAWRAGRREFAVVVAVQLAAGLAVAVQLLVVKQVLTVLLPASRAGGNFSDLVPYLILFAAVTVVSSFASAVQFELQRVLGELVNRHTEGRVLEAASRAELEAFEDPAFHDRLERAQLSAGSRPMQMTQALLSLLTAGATIAGILAVLLLLQPLLVPLLLAAIIPLWLVAAQGSKSFYLYAWWMTPNDRRRGYLRRVLQTREFAKEVIAFGTAGFLRRLWDQLYDERLRELRSIARQRLRLAVVATLGSTLLTAAPVALLAYLVVAGRMSLPHAVAAAVGMVMLRPGLQSFSGAAARLYESALFLEDYASFTELSREAGESNALEAPPIAFSRLEIRDLSFNYPGSARPALTGISLQIRSGEVVALVGQNGSGKTTLAKLLAHLYLPTSGQVLWDGVDTRGHDRRRLRDSIAVLFQDFAKYGLSARHNIGLGRVDRFEDLAATVGAARDAGVDGVLESLPNGYETLLGPEFEGGKDLSTGQWQRVALARAFFRDAPFIILDEPSAALDAQAEHETFEKIRTLCRGRTVLLISHRFSTVRSADRIYVLKEGRLVEQGTHGELMRLGGHYAEMFTLQAAAYAEPAGR